MFGEVVFGGLFSTDPVGTTSLGGPVAMELGANVVKLKRDDNDLSYNLNTKKFSKFVIVSWKNSEVQKRKLFNN